MKTKLDQVSRVLTYATVCSGVECMSACCVDLPLVPIFFSEIEPFPCAVLKAHYPNVPNLGDMSKIKVSNDGKEVSNGSTRVILTDRIDILAGGTPCQDVSNAGLRRGMQEGSGTRSSLAFEFVRLIRELKPRFVLWENVAGVLSDPSFPEFLTQIAKCGYSVAYRTLDAQYIRCADIHHEDGRMVSMERAIPQRRRRVWVIGCAGADVAKATQILFEHKGIAGNTPPSRKTRKEASNAPRGSHNLHGGMVDGERGDGECDTPGREKLNQHNRTWWDGRETSSTLTTGGNRQFMPDCCRFDAVVEQHQVAYDMQRIGQYGNGDASSTLKSRDYKDYTDLVVHPQVECYKLDSTASNSMKSSNPHSGIHKAEVSSCLDTTIPEPSKAQGGNVVVECYATPQLHDTTNTPTKNLSPTISAAAGESGNNRPFVCDKVVISHQPATEVLDLQGGKIGANYTDDGTAPTLTHGRGSASDIHAVTMVNKEAE